MRLCDAANAFNDMVCADAYSGVDLFLGQLGLFDDSKRDSEAAGRRIISLAPSVVPPVRRVIAAAGTKFILGHANPDDYRGSIIRVGYVAQEAPYLAQVRTLEQVCRSQSGFTAYAGRAWVKDLAYSEQDSNKVPEYHIHFAPGEPVVPDLMVLFEGRLNIVRSVNYGVGGTLVATCDQMDEPSVEMASVLVGTYDPITDTTTGSPVVVRVVRLRWQSLFAYKESIAPKFGPGEIQVALAKSDVTMRAGAILTLSDGPWRVESALSEGNVWLCKAVRTGTP